jgi:TPR repeat protein
MSDFRQNPQIDRTDKRPRRWIAGRLLATVILLAASFGCGPEAAEQIKGRVAEVSGLNAKILLSTTDGVSLNDAVEITEYLADIQEEAHVASAVVSKIQAGSIWVTVGRASGKVAAGQQARVVFTSKTQPVKGAPPQSTILPEPAGPAGVRENSPSLTKDPTATSEKMTPIPSGPGALGLVPLRNFDSDPEKQRGTRVYFVDPKGAAKGAGIREDDVLLSVGDESWDDSLAALSAGHSYVAGQQAEIVFRRGGRFFYTTATFPPKRSAAQIIEDLTALASSGDPRAQVVLAETAQSPRESLKEDDEAKRRARITWFRKAAAQNDAYAQRLLAEAYVNGVGVAQDRALADSWYRKGAELGDPVCQLMVGRMYNDGQGVVKDLRQAVRWYLKSAEQGYEMAQTALGDMYLRGDGVDRDVSKAATCYRIAAEQGVTDAKRMLGELYANGLGLQKDFGEAKRWLREAADNGDGVARLDLARVLWNSDGSTEDRNEGFKLLLELADTGTVDAQMDVGAVYYTGQHVARDYGQAVRRFRAAAEQHSPNGEFALGVCYEAGNGVEKDELKAVEWYHRAAKQGHATAQANLGVMCLRGQGVQQDYKVALGWCRLAAKQGEGHGEDALGVMYENGLGVEANRVEAITWYLKAAAHGDDSAKQHLQNLGIKP